MFSGEKRKLMIVCTPETEKYGKYLIQLVSSKDDTEDKVVGLKDGSVDAVLWTEKDYNANRSTVSISSYLLFIGDSKLTKTVAANMNTVYDKYGMVFASLGNSAVMNVSKQSLKKKDYEEFMAMCARYQRSINIYKLKFLNKVNIYTDSKGFISSALYMANIRSPLGFAERAKIVDERYTFLTLYACMELLPKFLEG